MTPSLAISLVALVLAVVAFVRSFQHSVKTKATLAEKRDVLGKRYAALGWAYSAQQSEFSDPEKAAKHAYDGFIIADTSLDGKRDFSDTQVRIYVEAARPK